MLNIGLPFKRPPSRLVIFFNETIACSGIVNRRAVTGLDSNSTRFYSVTKYSGSASLKYLTGPAKATPVYISFKFVILANGLSLVVLVCICSLMLIDLVLFCIRLDKMGSGNYVLLTPPLFLWLISGSKTVESSGLSFWFVVVLVVAPVSGSQELQWLRIVWRNRPNKKKYCRIVVVRYFSMST